MKNLPNCIYCNNEMVHIFDYMSYGYVKCDKCEIVSTDPIPSKKIIEKHYLKKFETGNYSLIREYSSEYMNIYEGFADKIEKHLEEKSQFLSNKKVLDIGCFTGDFLDAISRRGADVYGLELQQEAIEIANKKFPSKVFKADVFSNDFPDLKYDIITLFGLIEHVVDPIKLLNRANQLLNPGGIIVLQTPNSSSLFATIMKKYWFCYAPVEHIHVFSKKSMDQILKGMSFKNINISQHWKKLPIAYIFSQLQNFGPEFAKILRPFKFILEKIKLSFPLYAGEMFIIADKPK